MPNPIIRIHNIETNEIIDREMTKAEFDAYKAEQAQETAKAAADAAKAAASASAVAKLEAIGLTAEEIAALRA